MEKITQRIQFSTHGILKIVFMQKLPRFDIYLRALKWIYIYFKTCMFVSQRNIVNESVQIINRLVRLIFIRPFVCKQKQGGSLNDFSLLYKSLNFEHLVYMLFLYKQRLVT